MKKILVVSHDAGGAEVISSWVKRNAANQYSYILDGPAVNIFGKKVKDLKYKKIASINQEIQSADMVLTGTSWQSSLENEAIYYALRNNVKVISYLDSWRNYRERFIFNGALELPDEIWVGDAEAKTLAEKEFPSIKIKFVPNCYFMDMKEEIETISETLTFCSKLRILYICEPIAKAAYWRFGDENFLGYNEHDAIRFFFSCLKNGIPIEQIESIIFRPHPADEEGKYLKTLEEFSAYPIYFSNNPLSYDCALADYIVGCSSMALVIGLLARKKVFTCIPVQNAIFELPHKEIISFQEHLEGVENKKGQYV